MRVEDGKKIEKEYWGMRGLTCVVLFGMCCVLVRLLLLSLLGQLDYVRL